MDSARTRTGKRHGKRCDVDIAGPYQFLAVMTAFLLPWLLVLVLLVLLVLLVACLMCWRCSDVVNAVGGGSSKTHCG